MNSTGRPLTQGIFRPQHNGKSFIGLFVDVETKREMAGLALMTGVTLSDFTREALRQRALHLRQQLTAPQHAERQSPDPA